jgi:hypothetical protein
LQVEIVDLAGRVLLRCCCPRTYLGRDSAGWLALVGLAATALHVPVACVHIAYPAAPVLPSTARVEITAIVTRLTNEEWNVALSPRNHHGVEYCVLCADEIFEQVWYEDDDACVHCQACALCVPCRVVTNEGPYCIECLHEYQRDLSYLLDTPCERHDGSWDCTRSDSNVAPRRTRLRALQPDNED